VSVVNVVVTCTKEKRRPVAVDCQLRNVPEGSLAERMKQWQARLSRRWRERVLVEDLYAGDHWSNVRSFGSSYFDIDIWVCSAGFGLVRFDDAITPYAATFSGNHPDSVSSNLNDVDRAAASKHWWESTSQWKAHFKNRPRSLTALMAAYPDRSMVVAASETYLRAIADDLRAGLPQLKACDQLSIICAGVQSLPGLEGNLIPCDARMQAATGGARRSLNTRLVNKILREARVPPRADSLTKRFTRLLAEQPPIKQYDRAPMTDQQVKRFIFRQLATDRSKRHTPLLRMFREAGNACEQKRFASLYQQVRSEIDG